MADKINKQFFSGPITITNSEQSCSENSYREYSNVYAIYSEEDFNFENLTIKYDNTNLLETKAKKVIEDCLFCNENEAPLIVSAEDEWSPESWRDKDKKQMPVYKNQQKLNKVKESLINVDGLVQEKEIHELKNQLKKVYNEKAFFIQIGDCAESFNDLLNDNITKQQKYFLTYITLLLNNFLQKEIITIGRIAGQFAKPRTSEVEKINGKELPSYKGDIINSCEFSREAREPKPELMIEAYNKSKNIINILKANDIKDKLEYDEMLKYFLENENFKNISNNTIKQIIDFQQSNTIYTSHEALLLDYEECFIRNNILTSAHTVWLGDRTRALNSAHVEFLRGIDNPISIKCGPKTDIEELIKIIKTINPKNEENKITLIIRAGVNNLNTFFPKLIEEVKKNDLKVIWCSDPMHGNGKTIGNKKTRDLNDISSEIKEFLAICKEKNIYAGGLHLEATGQNVTECISETCKLEDLDRAYKTLCDPRLNPGQTIELLNNIFNTI